MRVRRLRVPLRVHRVRRRVRRVLRTRVSRRVSSGVSHLFGVVRRRRLRRIPARVRRGRGRMHGVPVRRGVSVVRRVRLRRGVCISRRITTRMRRRRRARVHLRRRRSRRQLSARIIHLHTVNLRCRRSRRHNPLAIIDRAPRNVIRIPVVRPLDKLDARRERRMPLLEVVVLGERPQRRQRLPRRRLRARLGTTDRLHAVPRARLRMHRRARAGNTRARVVVGMVREPARAPRGEARRRRDPAAGTPDRQTGELLQPVAARARRRCRQRGRGGRRGRAARTHAHLWRHAWEVQSPNDLPTLAGKGAGWRRSGPFMPQFAPPGQRHPGNGDVARRLIGSWVDRGGSRFGCHIDPKFEIGKAATTGARRQRFRRRWFRHAFAAL